MMHIWYFKFWATEKLQS